MATVWAAHFGKWTPKPNTGWSHFFIFSNLVQLTQQLSDAQSSLLGSVTKLGIVAHGDKPGIVELKPDPDLSATTADAFATEFGKLNKFLGPYARIIFYCCIAGADVAGTNLLCLLSHKYFPDRHVIGFDVFGRIAPEGFENEVGSVTATADSDPKLNFNSNLPTGPNNNIHLSEYAWQAKWAFQGKIIKTTITEENQTSRSVQTFLGPKAIQKVLAGYPKNGDTLHYISIQKDRAKDHQLRQLLDVIAAKINTRSQLRFESEHDIFKAAKTHHHDGAIAVIEVKTSALRCANPQCPTHHLVTDFCEAFARQFPNGPLQ